MTILLVGAITDTICQDLRCVLVRVIVADEAEEIDIDVLNGLCFEKVVCFVRDVVHALMFYSFCPSVFEYIGEVLHHKGQFKSFTRDGV